MSGIVTLRVHGPNNVWTLSVPLVTAERVMLELRNGRWATVMAEQNYGFGKTKKDYHFNPELVVCVEIEDESNVPF